MNKQDKKIIDVCCGGKMFWFDKNNPNVEFCDKRKEKHVLCDGRIFEISPDTICDFTKLPFEDNSFKLVVFDPPHLKRSDEQTPPTGYQQIKYGALYPGWEDIIHKGFMECFRVLDFNGILIFKWNETNVKVSEILKLAPVSPLFGHKSGKQSKTHWICFMKGLTMKKEVYCNE